MSRWSARREALLLRDIRGFSYEQLADSLALSRPSVRSLLSRARRRLYAHVRNGSATLGGISWLEPLARLFAGGPDTAVSAATKVTAVGLGAAAVLGGAAAVAPDLGRHPPWPIQSSSPARAPAVSAPGTDESSRAAGATPPTGAAVPVAGRATSVSGGATASGRVPRPHGRDDRSGDAPDATSGSSRGGSTEESGSEERGLDGAAATTGASRHGSDDGTGGSSGPSGSQDRQSVSGLQAPRLTSSSGSSIDGGSGDGEQPFSSSGSGPDGSGEGISSTSGSSGSSGSGSGGSSGTG